MIIPSHLVTKNGGPPHKNATKNMNGGAPPMFGGAPPYYYLKLKYMGGPPHRMGGPPIHTNKTHLDGGAPPIIIGQVFFQKMWGGPPKVSIKLENRSKI